MKTVRLSIVIIFLVTVFAVLIDLPDNVPLKLSLGPLKIDRVFSPPKGISTHLGLDLQGGVELVLEADMQGIEASQKNNALQSAKEVIERRVNFFGVSEPVIQSAIVGDSHRVIVELPGLTNTESAIAHLGQTAKLEFREPIDSTSSAFFFTLDTTKETGLTGKDLKKAEVVFDSTTGEPAVGFELSQDGGQKFAELTKRLLGRPLVIFLDEQMVSAPYVRSEITDGRGTISGGFSQDEAKRFALTLSAGALPTPIKIIEQRTIGATLGAISIEKSIRAAVFGLLMVALFMVLYYGRLGMLAVVGLVIYGLVTFALFRLIPVTLTLSGIAGFILSIGMAVDSNILIFARLKEELQKGKPWHIALELAFGRAWDSIRDANFTTILTALILYNPLNFTFIPVSGLVRGFALTLIIGVLVSLFTGIFVTRNLLRAFYRPKEIIIKKN